MIRAYNRKELLLGIGSLILSLFGFVCAFLFFRYVPAYVFYSFGVKVAEVWFTFGATGALLLICACGYVRWKGKGAVDMKAIRLCPEPSSHICRVGCFI